MKRLFVITIFFQFVFSLIAQNGRIQGKVFNMKNNELVPFVNMVIKGTSIGTVSTNEGSYVFEGLQPGFAQIQVSAVGFRPYLAKAVLVTNANTVFVDIFLEETTVKLDAVEIKLSPFRRNEQSPVSLQTIGIKEIEKNPGGNRDISKIIQSLPGVSSSVSFRNDVIVRGGGPSENRFYLDGVEIPNLNHFSTQGASGGPVGIINIDFIREVSLYSGAFPSNRGNALSSVLDFKQIDGNKERLKTRVSVGASDMSLTLDGPLGKKTSFVFSTRRSYLQFLFKALGLPFLPTYNDAQFKLKTRIDEKNEITVVGLGALDLFRLNLDADETEGQRYILSYLPVNEQWNYTLGLVYKHYGKKGYDTWVISRNFLNNTSYKYKDNVEKEEMKILDYSSDEGEYKLRYEKNIKTDKGYKVSIGFGLEKGKYINRTINKKFDNGQLKTIDYKSDLDVYKYSLFSQLSNKFLDDRLSLSFGLRTDANNFSSSMKRISNQLSPRLSASYMLTNDFYFNSNMGVYYQMPPYTMLGYRNNAGDLVNQSNDLKYIRAKHYVFGIEYLPTTDSKFSIEGFLKNYSNYPFSLDDSVSMASKGGDFGTYGNEEVISTSKGRSYGFEFLARNNNLKGWNIILAYTFVRSEFKDKRNTFIPSSWDNKSILNITVQKTFQKNWDIGLKWRFVGGAPYTPYDLEQSSLIEAWDAQGREYLDYKRYNKERLSSFHQLDIRIDKQYFFDKWSLMLYLDIQNLYGFQGDRQANYIRETDQTGKPIIDPKNSSKYLLKKVDREGGGTILPTVGVMVEF